MGIKNISENLLRRYVTNGYVKYTTKIEKYPLLVITRLSLYKILAQVASLYLIIVGGGIIIPLLVQSKIATFQVYEGIFLVISGIVMYTYIEKLVDYRLEIVSKQAIKKYNFKSEKKILNGGVMVEFKNWFKHKFTKKRLITAITFSAVLGVSYWATTIYEKAFNSSWWLAILAFLLVAAVLLIFGSGLLDAITKK